MTYIEWSEDAATGQLLGFVGTTHVATITRRSKRQYRMTFAKPATPAYVRTSLRSAQDAAEYFGQAHYPDLIPDYTHPEYR